MHPEVAEFIRFTSDMVEWRGARVLEIGAQDVNGCVRDVVAEFAHVDSWTGIDLVDGPGVDYVGDAETVLTALDADGERYDVVVSTEVLEHAKNWAAIVRCAAAVVAPGGWLVLTCAAPGRPPHGANGGPLGDGEYYRNVSASEIRDVLRPYDFIVTGYSTTFWPQDTRFIAYRPTS